VVACGAVSKGRGTLRPHVGCNAPEDGVLCACTPVLDEPPQHALSPHMARGDTAQQHAPPVQIAQGRSRHPGALVPRSPSQRGT
jgi:hypothetical protein